MKYGKEPVLHEGYGYVHKEKYEPRHWRESLSFSTALDSKQNRQMRSNFEF
jgi:hypothetical protein